MLKLPKADRRRRLVELCEAAGFGAFLCTQRANVRYLTGFTGSNGWALVGPCGTTLLTDERYRQQAADEAPGCELIIAATGLAPSLTQPLGRVASIVAFESKDVSVAVSEELENLHGGIKWEGCGGLVEQLRVGKEGAEILAVRRALEVAESALEDAVESLRPGVTELDFAAALEHGCRVRGAERMSFDTIVAAGRRAALPHARPTVRSLRGGDLLVVDMGCVVDGYCSDITRAVYLGGELPASWQQVHEALVAARDAALSVLMAGIAGCEVDEAARQELSARNLEAAFVHSLGHGIGLEVHEAPRLAKHSRDVLVAGTIVTIEPGVYLPGKGGMRLEDLVLVKKTGSEVLNRLPPSAMFAPI